MPSSTSLPFLLRSSLYTLPVTDPAHTAPLPSRPRSPAPRRYTALAPIFSSTARTTPGFLATPPVIIKSGSRPTRCNQDRRPCLAMARQTPLAISAFSLLLAIREITSDSAKTEHMLVISIFSVDCQGDGSQLVQCPTSSVRAIISRKRPGARRTFVIHDKICSLRRSRFRRMALLSCPPISRIVPDLRVEIVGALAVTADLRHIFIRKGEC